MHFLKLFTQEFIPNPTYTYNQLFEHKINGLPVATSLAFCLLKNFQQARKDNLRFIYVWQHCWRRSEPVT